MAQKICRKKRWSGEIQLVEGACMLCYRTTDNKNKFGEKRTLDGVTAHNFCALFASGLFQNGNEDKEGIAGFLIPDIRKEAARAKRLKCSFCNERGATIGCCVGNCRVSFHFPCGLENNVLNQYFGSFSSFCSKHRPLQNSLKRKRSSPKKNTNCSICLCSIENILSYDVLLTPCCRNAQFHRECVQRHAQSSGLHFFKCPLCNNKEKFQNEMSKFGIFIPDRDAEWELEENAFSELLVRHNHCDVKKCLCPHGRDSNEMDSIWELMLCDCCGSQGTHLTCSQLQSPQDDWMCDLCTETFDSSTLSAGRDINENEKEATKSTVTHISVGQRRKRNSKKKTTSAEDIRRYLIFGGTSSAALTDITTTSSNVSVATQSSCANVQKNLTPSDVGEIYKPRRRCLSRYIQMHKHVGMVSSPNAKPRWIKNLLNDDIHTGRNLGSKLAFMCPKTENEDQQTDEIDLTLE